MSKRCSVFLGERDEDEDEERDEDELDEEADGDDEADDEGEEEPAEPPALKRAVRARTSGALSREEVRDWLETAYRIGPEKAKALIDQGRRELAARALVEDAIDSLLGAPKRAEAPAPKAAAKGNHGGVRGTVLAALRVRSPQTTAELVSTTGQMRNSVTSAIDRLKKDGLVLHVGPGTYAIAPAAQVKP